MRLAGWRSMHLDGAVESRLSQLPGHPETAAHECFSTFATSTTADLRQAHELTNEPPELLGEFAVRANAGVRGRTGRQTFAEPCAGAGIERATGIEPA